MDGIQYIKDWEELAEIKSETHDLEIDFKYGSGWITSKTDSEDYHYLSTHTFYGMSHKESTRILQSCGFNVELANWDEIGM
jgi:hypothetical protein